MQPFVINSHGRMVFPSNFLPELDFSVIDDLDQLDAVIRRDFEAKAPSGTEILQRIEAGDHYSSRYELMRDVALNMFWTNRFAMTMYDKRPTRWRDVPRNRDDVFLPVLTPWEDAERKVAAVEELFAALPATWDGEVEDRIFQVLFDVLRHRRFHATELPAVKPTVAEILAQPDSLTYSLASYDPDYPVYGYQQILDCTEDVAELEALHRWAMVLHNQYPWDRTHTRLTPVEGAARRRLRGRLPPPRPRGARLHPTRHPRRLRQRAPEHGDVEPGARPSLRSVPTRRSGCGSGSACCRRSRRWPRSRASACAPTTTSSATPPTAGRRCRPRRSPTRPASSHGSTPPARWRTSRCRPPARRCSTRAAARRRSARCCSARAPAPG